MKGRPILVAVTVGIGMPVSMRMTSITTKIRGTEGMGSRGKFTSID